MDVFWIEAQPWDGTIGAAVTVRACSADLSPITLWGGGQEYLPVMDGGLITDVNVFSGTFTGTTSASRGEIALVSGAGEIDDWARLAWADRPVKVWWAEILGGDNPNPTWPAARTLIFDGEASSFDPDDAKLLLSVKVPSGLLADAFYAGTGGAEGSAEMKGVRKPFFAGQHRNRTALLLDATKLLFQTNAYGAIQALIAVREAGRILDQPFVEHATIAALIAAVVPAEQIHVHLGSGSFRLGFQPVGPISADFNGYVGTGYADRTGALIKQMILKTGWDAAKIHQASLDEIDAAFPHAIWLADDGGRDVAELLNEAMSYCAGYWDVDELGVFYVGQFAASVPAFSIGDEGQADFDILEIDHLPTRAPFWRNRVGYGFNPNIYDYGDTELGATPEQLELIQSAQDTADGKIDVYFQDGPPAAGNQDDLWFDTDDDLWYRFAVGPGWQLTRDAGVGLAIAAAAGAQATADGKITTYFTDAAPAAPAVGDLWSRPSDIPRTVKRWSGATWDAQATVGADLATQIVDSGSASPYATVPRNEIRTPLGTAAAIVGQGTLATRSTVVLGTTGQVYREDGSTRLTDALAVTSLGTASAISGQGALATTNAADFATQVYGVGKPSLNAGTSLSWLIAGSPTVVGNDVTFTALGQAVQGQAVRGPCRISFKKTDGPNVGLKDAAGNKIELRLYAGGVRAFVNGVQVGSAAAVALTGAETFWGFYDGVNWGLGWDGTLFAEQPAVANATVHLFAEFGEGGRIYDVQFQGGALLPRSGSTLQKSDGSILTDGLIVTSAGTAAAISGQGTFATVNSAAYGSALLTGFGALAPRSEIYFGDTYLKETIGGTTASLANFKTASGTAAAIAGQGAFATASSVAYGSSYLTGFGTLAPRNTVRLANEVYRADGSTVLTDALAVTSLGTASAISGQGAFATVSSAAYGSALLTGFGSLAPRSEIYFGDTYLKEATGGATATLSNFKTSSGTAASISGQGAFATVSSAAYGSSLLTGFGALAARSNARLGNEVYRADGATLLTDALAVTSLGTAAAISGQGAFATVSSAAYGSSLLTGFGPIAPLSEIAFGQSYLKETAGGTVATLATFKTISGTAAAIVGQGTLATKSAVRLGGLVGSKWRFAGNGGGRSYWAFVEVQMRGSVGGADLTLGKTATASSAVGGPDAGINYDGGAASAIDDNFSTGWHSNAGSSHWYQVDFGEPVGIGEIVITSRPNNTQFNDIPTSATAQVSTDGGVTWTVAATYASIPVFGNSETRAFAVTAAPADVTGALDFEGSNVGNKGRVSKLVASTGVAADSSILPANTLYGLIPSLKDAVTISDTDNGGTVTINIGTAVFYPDAGGTVTFASGSSAGKAYDTLYFIKRTGVDPVSAPTGTAWNVSTVLSIAVGEVYVNSYTTRASAALPSPPPPPPPGGGETCVAAAAWVETRDRGFVLAGDIVAGDMLRVLDDEREGTRWERCTANEVNWSEAVFLRTENGHTLTCSISTPITLRDGTCLASPIEADGLDLPVYGNRLEWSRCRVSPTDPTRVAHIRCSQRTYAAGDVPGLSILTHNPLQVKP